MARSVMRVNRPIAQIVCIFEANLIQSVDRRIGDCGLEIEKKRVYLCGC